MPRLEFDSLSGNLLRAGVAPRHVARAIVELREHFEDIENELVERGETPDVAAILAVKRIGAIELIEELYRGKPELKCWSFRHPQIARVFASVEHAALLPAIPFRAMAGAAPAIARWCACLILSGVFTASLLLAMQVTISFG